MFLRKTTVLLGLIALIIVGYLASSRDTENAPYKKTYNVYVDNFKRFDPALIRPLPIDFQFPVAKVALGERLFSDQRLSHNNTLACVNCHNLQMGGVDRLPRSITINGVEGRFNTPTVFNSGFNIAQFWDGRTKTLEEQVAEPIHNPGEMNSNWNEVIAKLGADDKYLTAFNMIYADGITAINIADAIATFERSLITPNSRLDLYLRGAQDILSSSELEGFRRFTEYGCVSCHQGVNVGGNMFQHADVMEGYINHDDEGHTHTDHYGRFNVTGLEIDRYVYKVPGLRNVAVTAPYFHDGSVKTLESAVLEMGHDQLGRQLSSEDVRLITLFLHTLTGRWNGETLQ